MHHNRHYGVCSHVPDPSDTDLCETCEHPRRRHVTQSALKVLGCVYPHCECAEFDGNPTAAARRLVDARFTGPCMRMWRKVVQVRGVSSAPRCWVTRDAKR
jgi:hypothetical protein